MKKVKRIFFSIGGYGSVNHEIRYRDGIAKYSKHRHMIVDEDKPKNISSKELDNLSSALFKLGVHKWKKRYDSMVLDGTQWEMKILYSNGDRKSIYGSNAYPNPVEEDKMSYSPDFIRLLDILSEFIGDPDFFRANDGI